MVRAAGLFGLWLVLTGSFAPADLAMGAVAAGLGAWASLRLLPEAPRLRWAELWKLPGQMLVAGTDVAWRAVTLRIAPGLVPYAPKLEGAERDAFLAVSALMPGTVPAAPGLIHTIDTTQPVAAQMVAEEARYARG